MKGGGEDRELTVVVGGQIISCAKDGVFELTANIVEGEYEGEEGGGCFAWPMKVFSETFDAHEASEAGDAANGDEVFSINVNAHDVSALHVDGPSEVAGGVNVRLHVHPLVMVRVMRAETEALREFIVGG